ncbi:MAG: hypothetical protein Q9178_007152 [Gyalolechia marmorata]
MDSHYVYKPLLSRGSIRVLTLHPATDPDAPVSCDLDEVSLHKDPKYYAVSYSWDAQERSCPVHCAGHQLLTTPNCLAALRQFRQNDKPEVLWVDSLCIDQTSIPEKNEQVAPMGEIYKTAQYVIVWLGTSDRSTDIAIKTFKEMMDATNLTRENIQSVLQGRVETLVKSIEKESEDPFSSLFQRSWFGRLWTVQEVVLPSPRKVHVCCGSNVINWVFLLGAIDRLRLAKYPWAKLNDVVRVEKYLSKMIDSQRYPEVRAILASMPGDIVRGPSVSHILTMARKKASTDPRDKVYALLGVFQELEFDCIMPDYSKSTADVYREATAMAIKNDNDLFLLFQALDMKIADASDILRDSPRKDDSGSWILTDFVHNICTCFHVIRTWVEVSTWYAKYPTGESVKAALRRTLIQDDPETVGRPTFEAAFEAWYSVMTASEVEVTAKILEASHKPATAQDFSEEVIQRCIAEIPQEVRIFRIAAIVSAYHWVAVLFSNRKCFFTTEEGYMGTAPDFIQSGDCIALISGVCMPLVLRPVSDGFHLVTHAYVHGVMYGDAWPDTDAENEIITLV